MPELRLGLEEQEGGVQTGELLHRLPSLAPIHRPCSAERPAATVLRRGGAGEGARAEVLRRRGRVRRERERVFARSWIPVCRLEDVASPGDYITYDLAGDPIVVTRTRDGVLTALANVCRHRNMVIMQRVGQRARRCSARTTSGPTASTGRSSVRRSRPALEGFDKADHCLPRLAVETWQGFVLVQHRPGRGAARPAARRARRGGRRAADRRDGAGRLDQLGPAWNWKVTFENYAESYHHQGIHTDTLQPFFPGERSMPIVERGASRGWRLDHDVGGRGHRPVPGHRRLPAALADRGRRRRHGLAQGRGAQRRPLDAL